jgi:hypothetical protein
MVPFLELPRELRDMIYEAVITMERPRPSYQEVQWSSRFQRVLESYSVRRGEYGCAYSLEPPPATCANLLQCNRQVYHEMSERIEWVRKKGLMAMKLDCIAEDESFHYFTWICIPLVETTVDERERRSNIVFNLANRLIRGFGEYLSSRTFSTLVHQLWIDVRLCGDRHGKWFRNSCAPDRTSWAICAALKRFFDQGPDFSSKKSLANSTITVGELVLNVVTPRDVPEERYLDEGLGLDQMQDGLVHPRTVAKELVDVWNTIWSGHGLKGSLYQVLLERIKQVRVCVNGKTFKERELRLELERGRRIVARRR